MRKTGRKKSSTSSPERCSHRRDVVPRHSRRPRWGTAVPFHLLQRRFSMKRSMFGFIALGLIALFGCDQGTPGGPGVTNPSEKKPVVSRASDTFTLAVPTLAVSLKQGEAKTTSI